LDALYLEPYFLEANIEGVQIVQGNPIYLDVNNKVEILFVKLGFQIDEKLMSSFPRLKFIVTPTTGLDHINLNYCEQLKITIINLSPLEISNIYSTTEIAIWHIINLSRKVMLHIENVRKSNWNRYSYPAESLKEHSVGIVGYGRLGRQVHSILKIFDSNPRKMIGIDKREVAKSIEEIFATSSIVSLHMSATKENAGIIDAKILSHIKKVPFYLVNTSRGSLVNELDLVESIEKGLVSGYAADSIMGEYGVEPNLCKANPIWKASVLNPSSIFLTPHIGGATLDSMRVSEQIVYRKLDAEIREIEKRR
jgi:D-3-phosphoglycerate dehydrogenase